MLKSNISKFLLISTLLLTACGGGGSSGDDSTPTSNSGVNKAPVADAGSDRKAQINIPVLVWGSASDSDGTISSYEWKKGEEVLGTTADLRYTPTKLGTERLTLTVVDDDGASASDSIELEIVTEAVEDSYNNSLPF